MPALLTMDNRNLQKYNKKVANMHDLFDLLSTLLPPISAKFSQSYVGACAVFGILKFSNSISQIFIVEKIRSLKPFSRIVFCKLTQMRQPGINILAFNCFVLWLFLQAKQKT